MKSLPVLLLVLNTFYLQAQPAKQTIKVLAKANPDGVWLRWAPADATIWQLGNQHGYRIDRYTVNTGGILENNEPVCLNPSPTKPFTQEQLDALAKSIPEASAISELIYETESKSNERENESPAQLLKRSEALDNRFGMALLLCDLTPTLARAAGLFFKDSTFVKGARYIYKVSLATAGTKITVEPGVMVVDVAEPKPLQPFNDLQTTFGDKTVTLSWTTLTHTGIYTAYLIEKSDDGKTFKTITDLPYLPMSESESSGEAHYVDSLENNYQSFYYRVTGITPFGEKGPPSNITSGKGKDNLAGLLILREVKKKDKSSIEITWEFPLSFENKIGGFAIEKAPRAEGPYTAATKSRIDKKLRTFIDAALASSAYYRATVVDMQGQVISHSLPYFFHVEDNTPPAVPIDLVGKIDLKGIATLVWKNNPDSDLLGYRVFTSHDVNHEFVEVTTRILPAPAYSDTVSIRGLNKKIFYKVVAVDYNFNTSGYSKPLALYKPDVIAPAAPVFGKIEKKDRSIVLRWTNSVSTDAANYTLFRTNEKDPIKTNLLNWRADRPRNEFQDNKIVTGETYRYILSVLDSAGNVSSVQSKAVALSMGVHEAVSDITATIERDKKRITLAWSYDAQPAKKCLLYKRKNNEPFTLYQTLEGPVQEFADDQVQINNTYSYKIQLVLEKNARTELSKELKVPF